MVDASHPLLRPERCSRSGDSERASRSAVWASLLAPDNFTIPALAGGDNHIKLPWQEALNSAPVPLRVWHPAVSPEHAADVTMRRFVFWFFHSMSSLLFFFLFSFLPPPPSKYICERFGIPCHWGRKSELAESSVTAIALWKVSLFWFVMVNSTQFLACQSVLRNIFENFHGKLLFHECHLEYP